jgi:hypothetical protein
MFALMFYKAAEGGAPNLPLVGYSLCRSVSRPWRKSAPDGEIPPLRPKQILGGEEGNPGWNLFSSR